MFIKGFISVMFFLLFCQQGEKKVEKKEMKEEKKMEIKVISSAFEHEGMIPMKYTCDGEDISPPLKWEGIPENAKSIALICDDPDAPMGTWVHWVLYDLPADIRELPGGIPTNEVLENGAKQGKNSWGKIGYGGPCPPSGTHRYFFKIYVLDTILNLKPGATKEELLKAMEGHIITRGELMGKYKTQIFR